MNRRAVLAGLLAAPMVVRTPGLLMPVRQYRKMRYITGMWDTIDGRVLIEVRRGSLVGPRVIVPVGPYAGTGSRSAPMFEAARRARFLTP